MSKHTVDTNNKEFQDALNLIQYTRQSVFLTGKAGTGKSTFLKYVCANTKKKHIVLAPTGIAAINAGGSTMHSFFKLPFYPLLPDDPIKRIISQDKKVALLLFEPWKNDSPDSIIKSFFDLYKEEVNKYAPNLSPIINKYVLTLLNEESSGIVKFCTQLSELFINGGKSEDLYDDMKEHLKKIAHKTIIFIDDIDRLNAPEIMEVLRLIRNTANFPFLQFIVTYDKEYLIKALEHSGVPKSEQYLEKIFNLEIPLPKFEERIICYELHNRIKETLNSLFNIDKENLIYKDMIYHRCSEESSAIFDYLIPKILENNRDVIRFHNSFYLILRCFQNNSKEIDYKDLFYLELIRYRFPEIYNILRNSPLLLLNVTDRKSVV